MAAEPEGIGDHRSRYPDSWPSSTTRSWNARSTMSYPSSADLAVLHAEGDGHGFDGAGCGQRVPENSFY